MNESRRLLESVSPYTLRDVPMRPREWRALVENPGATHVVDKAGEMLIVPEQGQLHLHWAYVDLESMRRLFPRQFARVRRAIDPDRTDYVTMDLVAVGNRDWLEPLLSDAAFEFFAEWMEMIHPDLDPKRVPEFPQGVRMRRAEDADAERLYAIWSEAYGEYADGARTFDALVEAADWSGVLEADGEVAAFALNGGVERGDGRILTAAVAPEHWGNGYGRMVVAAAAYQLASREALRAVIKVRPDITQSLRLCSELGFRHFRSGVEYRRLVDEALIAQRHEARRIAGVKARFGEWR